MEQLELPYIVKLKIYEGPLDLLLELIKKNKMDIYEIRIAEITKQYLDYLEMVKASNLENVCDYLALAAELGYIKSRMLLPKSEDEDENQTDPKEELIKRLVEYEKYKKIAEKLNQIPILGRETFKRGAKYACEFGEPAVETEIEIVDLWSLVEAFKEFCKRKALEVTENLKYEIESFSITQRIEEIKILIAERRSILFEELFEKKPKIVDVVITFLALLEMVKGGILSVKQKDTNNTIEIVLAEGK